MAKSTKTAAVLLKGGINQEGSVLELTAGECIQLYNYEVNALGRYQRILGFERLDGQPSPAATLPSELDGYPFDSDEEELTALNVEKEARRTAIQPVPGSGPIRGTVMYNGVKYAFRDNVAGDRGYMWKATATGWQQVTTPFLFPGGRYEFAIANFQASASSAKLYGVDGVNRAFSFDGGLYIEIDGIINPDTPTHIEILPSQVLLLSYPNGSFLFSGVGEPTKFSAVDGGGEIGTSDEIIGMEMQASNSCAIFCRHRTYMLYGSSKDDFQLQLLSRNTGAIKHSIQSISESIYLDDRGLALLSRVQEFGNFDMATISQKVESLLRRYVGRVTASFVVKEKNQYRLCFDDGTGLIVTMFGNEVSGITTFDFGIVIQCAWSGEDDRGREVILFGSDDGYVYQAEKGFTFDGNSVPFSCRTIFYHFGSPEYKKRWRKIAIEAETVGEATIHITPDFNYSDPDVPFAGSQPLVVSGGGGYWDEGTWDESKWSTASTFTGDVYIDGVSRNLSVTISGNADDEPPHILNSYIVHYSQRGRRR